VCGLTGIIAATTRPDVRDVALKMCAELRHRGPDSQGSWVDERSAVALAHQRLAIVDLDDTGAQPMSSHDGRFVIAFNGEIYGFDRLRSELERKGVRFRGTSDTEVLIQSVVRFGLEKTLRRTRGMYAFALFDRRLRKVHLARDRFGEKPLYIARRPGELLFASELKSILAASGATWTLNRSAVASFLRYGYVPEPFTVLDAVEKVPAGSIVTIDVDGLVVGPALPYWSGAEGFLPDAPLATDEELGAALRESVAEQLVADVPVGAFLSGGIDSSLIVAIASRLSSRGLRTFTVGYAEADYDESPFAAQVAAHLGTDHHTLRVSARDALDVVPRLARMFDEPFGDSSAIPTAIVSEFASRSVKVSLSGDGGDELFGGYDRYAWAETIAKATCHIPRGIRRAAARAAMSVPAPAFRSLAPAIARTHPVLRGADEVRLRRLLDVASYSDLMDLYQRLVSHIPAPSSLVRGCPAELPTVQLPQAGSYQEHLMLHDTATYLPGDILVKVDRAGMASSLETRMPFLSPSVASVAWRGSHSWRNDDLGGKAPLRRLLEEYVPPELTRRPKMGFAVPVCDWLRGPLRPWAEGLLAVEHLESHGLLRVQPLRGAWEEHVSRTSDHSYHLWDVLMLNSWLDVWSHRLSTP
jgi:asparagine synthase (glutamine-hydrolysing)